MSKISVVYKVARSLTDDRYSTHYSIATARMARNQRMNPGQWNIYRWYNVINRWVKKE